MQRVSWYSHRQHTVSLAGCKAWWFGAGQPHGNFKQTSGVYETYSATIVSQDQTCEIDPNDIFIMKNKSTVRIKLIASRRTRLLLTQG